MRDVDTALAHVAGLAYWQLGQLCDRCGVLLQHSHAHKYWLPGSLIIQVGSTYGLAELWSLQVVEDARECS